MSDLWVAAGLPPTPFAGAAASHRLRPWPAEEPVSPSASPGLAGAECLVLGRVGCGGRAGIREQDSLYAGVMRSSLWAALVQSALLPASCPAELPQQAEPALSAACHVSMCQEL